MSDFIERFKQRQAVSPTVKIELEGVTFTVRRFSQEEMNTSGQRARAFLREEGLDPDQMNSRQMHFALAYGISEILKRHVVGWEFKDETTVIPFTPQAVASLIAEMDKLDRVRLGLKFIEATVADVQEQKKTEAPPAPSSSTSSAEDSPTS